MIFLHQEEPWKIYLAEKIFLALCWLLGKKIVNLQPVLK